MLTHLIQSTVFAFAAWLLVQSMRRNRARTRYAIWLTASLKFLVPFTLLVSAGAHLRWRVTPAIPYRAKSFVHREAKTTVASALVPWLSVQAEKPDTPRVRFEPLLLTIWFAGFACVLGRYFTEWRRAAKLVRAASPFPRRMTLARVPVVACSESVEPGVFGILRPVLLLPANIEERLTPGQLDAVIAHELFHIDRHDNLSAALHMLVEAVFWFHPLVWWIGSRLVEERERACDEAVIESGSERYAYAEGVLNVCKFYVQSPSACVSGVTGSNLRRRIEQIMLHRAAQNLRSGKKMFLALAASCAIAFPVLAGMLNAPRFLAQTQRPPEILKFEVASVKPGDPNSRQTSVFMQPGGKFATKNASVQKLIGFAFDVRNNQISGGPAWLGSAVFDIEAKPGAGDAIPPGRGGAPKVRLMVQSLLAERFKLATHRETREQQVYELIVDKGGPKLKAAADTLTRGPQGIRIGRGELTGMAAPLSILANQLSQQLGHSVIDKTGLSGTYDFKLKWTPDSGVPTGQLDGPDSPPPPESSGPSIFTAIREDLGLRLQAAKGPVEVIVIDHVEKPTGN